MNDVNTAMEIASKVHKGPIHSAVAGRTDHLPMHVASGSYVIPADIISAMGEGNSVAGFKVAKSIFSPKGPYGATGLPYGASGLPYGMPSPHKAGGGPITAYHASHEQFPDYDWSRLGRTTSENSTNNDDGSFSSNLARLGPWSSDRDHSKSIGMKHSLPVEIGGRGKHYRSLDHLHDDITRSGGPEAFRAKHLKGGYGHISVNDEELGGKSYVALHPDHFKVKKADGGPTSAVPIVAAGGEYVVPPEDVMHVGGGSLDEGHKVLDAFVKKMRQKTIKTLQKLPGPRKD